MTTFIEMKRQKVHNALKNVDAIIEKREDADEVTDETIRFINELSMLTPFMTSREYLRACNFLSSTISLDALLTEPKLESAVETFLSSRALHPETTIIKFFLGCIDMERVSGKVPTLTHRTIALKILANSLVVDPDGFGNECIVSLKKSLKMSALSNVNANDEYNACKSLVNLSIQLEGTRDIPQTVLFLIHRIEGAIDSNTVCRLGLLLETILSHAIQASKEAKEDLFNEMFSYCVKAFSSLTKLDDDTNSEFKIIDQANLEKITVVLNALTLILRRENYRQLSANETFMKVIPIAIALIRRQACESFTNSSYFLCVKASSSLLQTIHAEINQNYVKDICNLICLSLEESVAIKEYIFAISSLVFELSRAYAPFASTLFDTAISLMKNKSTSEVITLELFRVVDILLQSAPYLILKRLDSIITCLKYPNDDDAFHYRSVCLCLSLRKRMSDIFADNTDPRNKLLEKQIIYHVDLVGNNNWYCYKIVLKALECCNGKLASSTISRLPTSELSFPWFAVLQHLGKAWSCLNHSEERLPDAVYHLSMCLTFLQSREQINDKDEMDFQAGIISLYIDFLELCINIKRISSEMELAQKEMASKPSRNNLHRKNLVSCLCALARRFQYLKRRHTIGRTSLEINAMSRLCDVMAQLLCVSLEGMKSPPSNTKSLEKTTLSRLSINIITGGLIEKIINPIQSGSSTVSDPLVRAQLLNNSLKFIIRHLPFPSDLFKRNKIALRAFVRLFADPLDIELNSRDTGISLGDESCGFGNDFADVIDACNELDCDIMIHGKIAFDVFELLSSSHLNLQVCWKVRYDSDLEGESIAGESQDEAPRDNIVNNETNILCTTKMQKVYVHPDGSFLSNYTHAFLAIGYYRVDITMFYLDLHGNAWEFDLSGSYSTIFVRVCYG